MDWWAVAGNLLAGVAVAVVAALSAWLVTDRFAHRRELHRARHDRNLAAAEVLYSVYGDFFSTWKEWEFVRGRRRFGASTVSREVRQALLSRASDYEGDYESLIVRLTLEHCLTDDDRTALWAMRFALKELRRAIRRDAPLEWWRTDSPAVSSTHKGSQEYAAFKTLTTRVASILIDADPRGALPTSTDRRTALTQITGSNAPGGPWEKPLWGGRWKVAAEALIS